MLVDKQTDRPKDPNCIHISTIKYGELWIGKYSSKTITSKSAHRKVVIVGVATEYLAPGQSEETAIPSVLFPRWLLRLIPECRVTL